MKNFWDFPWIILLLVGLIYIVLDCSTNRMQSCRICRGIIRHQSALQNYDCLIDDTMIGIVIFEPLSSGWQCLSTPFYIQNTDNSKKAKWRTRHPGKANYRHLSLERSKRFLLQTSQHSSAAWYIENLEANNQLFVVPCCVSSKKLQEIT